MRWYPILLLILIWGCSSDESMLSPNLMSPNLRLVEVTNTSVRTDLKTDIILPLLYEGDKLTKVGLDSLIYLGGELSKIIRIDSFSYRNICFDNNCFETTGNSLFYSMSILKSERATTLMVDSIRWTNAMETFSEYDIPFLTYYKNSNGKIDSLIRTPIGGISLFNGAIKEVFNYDVEGNVDRVVSTYNVFGMPGVVTEFEKLYEYDMSNNPFKNLDEEVIIFFRFGPRSKNNPIRIEREGITNLSYEYNSFDYPVFYTTFIDSNSFYAEKSFEYEIR